MRDVEGAVPYGKNLSFLPTNESPYFYTEEFFIPLFPYSIDVFSAVYLFFLFKILSNISMFFV